MRVIDRLRRALLRWDRLLAMGAVLLPFFAASVLGFFWLADHHLLLTFIVVSIGLAGAVAVLRLFVGRMRRKHSASPVASGSYAVEPDPEWGPGELNAYRAAQATIRKLTEKQIDWSRMQEAGLEVITVVARESGSKGWMSFTLPEALLLTQQVSTRFRRDLREMVPFSDSITLETAAMVWRQRTWALPAARIGQGIWRALRVIKNPVAGVAKEIEGLLSGGNSSFLTGEAFALIQTMLLEEVAKAAVDLYSGRLRFSDAELLEVQMAGAGLDRARLARPDAPLRVVVAGQTSSGKSALVNALISEDRAETDVASSTDRGATFEMNLNGVNCMLVDLPGLDGGSTSRDSTLLEMKEADIVVWVTRANRPSCEIDRATLSAWQEVFRLQPERRQPPLVMVASCVDALVDGWPFPENEVPQEAWHTIEELIVALSRDLDTPAPIPVSAVVPEWNVDALRQRLVGEIGEGMMVQRNRARLAGKSPGFLGEISRAGRGLGKGVQSVGRRFARARGIDGAE